jgi:2-aminoadipate transaminase
MIIEIERESHIPLYAQIVTQVRQMIVRGVLKVGDRLPANRELARVLGINRNTVMTAYEELTAEGLISSHVGRGTFISAVPIESKTQNVQERLHLSPMPWSALLTNQKRDTFLSAIGSSQKSKEIISLAYSLPQPDLFPLEEFRRCVNRVLKNRGRALMEAGLSGGFAPLQEYLTSRMALDGISVKPEEVIITNGCQQSLNLIRQILVSPGDEVAIENPTYPGAINVLCASNSRFISVPVGEDGIDLDVFEDILSQRRPKFIYTIPSFQNPTGLTMSIQARRRFIELAARYRVPIVEDDIYNELRFEGAPLPTLKALDEYGLVIYINSFSKIGFPGLRVGWIAAPRVVTDQLNMAKRNLDFHTSTLNQAAIYEFSRHGLLAKYIKRLKRAFADRRDCMLAALEKYFPEEATWTRPEGGMAIWVRLPQSLNSSQILLESAEKGVVFSPGEHFYSSLPQQNFMRLSFTTTGTASIEEAIKRLGAVIKGRLLSLKKQRGIRKGDGYAALV